MKVDEFLDAIRFFGEPNLPKDVEKSIILAPYVLELSKYEGQILGAAFRLMMERRTFRNFPLLAECKAMCAEAQSHTRPQQRSEAPVITTSNRRTAQQLVLDNIELALDAVREDYIHGLWDFCRVNQRGPFGEKEIQQCKDDAIEFRRMRMKVPRPDADAREERLKALIESRRAA